MKIFSVIGITQSGKTTTIENIITELRARGYSVGSVKEIHYEEFAMDTPGTNTYRHRQAGSQLVTAIGVNETDILFQERLPIERVISFYDYDYMVLEGVADINAPKIITAHNTSEIDERMDYSTLAISGRVADEISQYKGLPVIHSINDTSTLVDLIEQKVPHQMPDFDPQCCDACGYTCRDMLARILMGEDNTCKIGDTSIRLTIDGKDIDMVPFVQKLLRNALLGVVSELDGYSDDSQIEVTIG